MDLSQLLLESEDDQLGVDVRLHRAALAGDVQLLSSLLQSADASCGVNGQLRMLGLTPLRLAVTGGSPQCVSCLLDHGAEIDAVDVKGQTPLFVAVRDEQLDCLKILLERGAAPDGSPRNLHTPLGQCCQSGWLPGLQLLLSAGADPEAALLRDGALPALPLHAAIVYHHLDCMLALLLAGGHADPGRRPGASPDAVRRVSLPHALLRHRCPASFLEVLHEFGGNLWQRDEKGRLAWQAEPHSPLVAYIKHLAGAPRSLQSLCRRTVRHALHGDRLRRVGELPLPSALIRYLLHFDTVRLAQLPLFDAC